jgi:hypothetical protein
MALKYFKSQVVFVNLSQFIVKFVPSQFATPLVYPKPIVLKQLGILGSRHIYNADLPLSSQLSERSGTAE